MRKLAILSSARRNFSDIFTYIADESGDDEVARRYIERLKNRCQHLAGLPGTLGTVRPQLGEGLRSTPCDGYVIFFRYRDDAVEIINILHASRDVEGYFSE